MVDSILIKHRKIWREKKILRAIYTQWYKMIINDLSAVGGDTVEIGSGTGNFKEYYPKLISSDIDSHPWLDMVFDAQKMPFKDKSISNIVFIDVLHHLSDPLSFFREALRVLESGGRIIMLEPYPSLFSLPIYKRFHPEPFIFNGDIFKKRIKNNKSPWESNQAIPYLLFFKNKKEWKKTFGKDFKIKKIELLSFLFYPLSGGFENHQLIPDCLIKPFEFIEKMLKPFGFLLGFRCYIVIEKINK
jgi:SAM-dependent methyltransferase